AKPHLAAAVRRAAGLVAGAAALAQRVTAGDEPTKPPPAAGAKPQPAEVKPAADKDSLAYGGRVLGPDGRPVPGAKLYLTPQRAYISEPYSSPEVATTGADGRFAFTAPKALLGDHAVVAATAANHGPGWVIVPAGGRRDDLTLQLAVDDVPITGQIVDLEGKPVPGATLRVLQINAAPGEDLGPWL